MASYEFLAGSYDDLTGDVGYPRWADYIERHFARLRRPVRSVLDLACGTGSLTRELAVRGYEMTGVDKSPEMLAQAEEKCRDLEHRPRLFCQGMEHLCLPEPVDACVCCLDSVNYVTRPAVLERAFQRVHLFLMPGGMFIFDVNTPEKLRSLDGQVFLDETVDTYCVWRAEYSARRRICTYAMDLFRLTESGLWERGEELHEEYAYEPDELEEMLRRAGFTGIKRYGERRMRAPREGEQRVFFVARKEM